MPNPNECVFFDEKNMPVAPVHTESHPQYLSNLTKIEVLQLLQKLQPKCNFPNDMAEEDVREYLWATHNQVY